MQAGLWSERPGLSPRRIYEQMVGAQPRAPCSWTRFDSREPLPKPPSSLTIVPGYRPVNVGGRFSRKDVTPSA
jgi:hypothetical protein